MTVFSSQEIQREDKDFVAGIIDETGKERYVMHAVDIIHDFYVKKMENIKYSLKIVIKENKNRNSDLFGEMINEEICSSFYGILYIKHWVFTGNYYIFVSK